MSSETGESIRYVVYSGECDLPLVSTLIEKELSEPYSIFTYRYFLNQWPDLCFNAMVGDRCIGTIVSKLEPKSDRMRGYIAMLAVDPTFRGRKIASQLVAMTVEAMRAKGANDVVLETELSNTASLALYEKLGFCRSKLLRRYYINGNDAYRLKLYLTV